MDINSNNLTKTALSVLDVEISALQGLKQFINDNFISACHCILKCQGKVIVTGMGKSGHIGRKLAATLASTGTPAFFVHPAEASHGDIGMISSNDVVLALSNSGHTDEVVKLIPVLKRIGAPLIALTGNTQSTIAKEANVHINVHVEKEACPLGLAPTSSTTAAMAMGDALAISLLNARGFTEQDFALSHPAGSLGRRLLLRVEDLMHSGERLPIAHQTLTIKEALLIITDKGMGFTAVVNDDNKLLGVYTDGDLRRSLDKKIDIHTTTLIDVVSTGCITTTPEALAAEALHLMEQKSINGLITINEQGEPVGAINMHDLLRAKVL